MAPVTTYSQAATTYSVGCGTLPQPTLILKPTFCFAHNDGPNCLNWIPSESRGEGQDIRNAVFLFRTMLSGAVSFIRLLVFVAFFFAYKDAMAQNGFLASPGDEGQRI